MSTCASAQASLVAMTRTLMAATSTPDLDPLRVLEACFQYMQLVRQIILSPLATELGNNQCKIDAGTINKVWDKSIENKVVAAFGAVARADAPSASKSKSCGPLQMALMLEWKQRICAGRIHSAVDLLEAFASQGLAEWNVRYAETFVPRDMACLNKQRIALMLSSTYQVMVREWIASLRSGVSSSCKISFTPHACAQDFMAVVRDPNHVLFQHIYSSVVGRNVSVGGAQTGARVAAGLVLGVKNQAAVTHMDAWIHTHYLSSEQLKRSNIAKQSSASDGSASLSSHIIYRTCKYNKCAESSGVDIETDSKYASIRCSAGCASTYHSSCYRQLESEFVETEAGSIACPHTTDDRRCTGEIVRVVLKQCGRGAVLSYLLGSVQSHDAEVAAGVEDVDDDQDESVGSSSASASDITQLSGRRLRNQKSASFWATQPKSRLRRLELVNGVTSYVDEVERSNDVMVRAEKRAKEEEARKVVTRNDAKEIKQSLKRAMPVPAAPKLTLLRSGGAKKVPSPFLSAGGEKPPQKPPVASAWGCNAIAVAVDERVNHGFPTSIHVKQPKKNKASFSSSSSSSSFASEVSEAEAIALVADAERRARIEAECAAAQAAKKAAKHQARIERHRAAQDAEKIHAGTSMTTAVPPHKHIEPVLLSSNAAVVQQDMRAEGEELPTEGKSVAHHEPQKSVAMCLGGTGSSSSMSASQTQAASASASAAAAAPTANSNLSDNNLVLLLENVTALPHNAPPSNVLLVRQVPLSVSISSLGHMFSAYGKVLVRLVMTRRHGLMAVVTFLATSGSCEMARLARDSLRGRTYQLEMSVVDADFGESIECELWQMDDVVFGQTPLQLVPTTVARMSLVQQEAVASPTACAPGGIIPMPGFSSFFQN